MDCAEYIRKNIETIASLDIPYQHIIVDGGSTDGTRKIIDEYDTVTLIDEQGRNGMYAAIHQGFENASGDYFAYVNADDQVIKDGFEAMYYKIQEQKSDLAYSDAFFIYEDSDQAKYIKGHRFAHYFLKKGLMPFVQPSTIYTREKYFELKGFDFQKFRLYGDLDFFQRLAYTTDRIAYSPKVSTKFLMRDDSLAHLNREKGRIELEKLRQNGTTNFITKILFKLSR